jgi:hypothetical protein
MTSTLKLLLAAVIFGLLAISTTAPALAHDGDRDWREHEWRRHDWQERAWRERERWREHEWRERHWRREMCEHGYREFCGPRVVYEAPPRILVVPY